MKRAWWTALSVGLVASVVVLATASGLQAQSRGQGGTCNVACLDVVEVFAEYERQKDLTEEMRTLETDTQAEMDRRRAQLDSLQATVDAMSDNDPQKVKRMREQLQLQLDTKNWLDLRQAELAREVGLWTRRMYTEMLAVTEEIALRDGYDLVMYLTPPQELGYDPDAVKEQIRARQVIYANPRIDITQAVLDKLNANYRAQPKTQMLQIGP